MGDEETGIAFAAGAMFIVVHCKKLLTKCLADA
jgi:hypothetical protein